MLIRNLTNSELTYKNKGKIYILPANSTIPFDDNEIDFNHLKDIYGTAVCKVIEEIKVTKEIIIEEPISEEQHEEIEDNSFTHNEEYEINIIDTTEVTGDEKSNIAGLLIPKDVTTTKESETISNKLSKLSQLSKGSEQKTKSKGRGRPKSK